MSRLSLRKYESRFRTSNKGLLMKNTPSQPGNGLAGDSRHKGVIFILASPSGGGKTTICKEILSRDDNIRFSVSYTSRKSRPGEQYGRDYYFVSEEEFKEKIKRKEFLEWAKVHERLYGTDRKRTEEIINSGFDLLMDIDIQGADSVKKAKPESVKIFILPPSRKTLERRLRERGTDDPEQLENRIQVATAEVERWRDFDYVVINNVLDEAVRDVRAVIKAERLSIRHSPPDVESVLRSFGLSV